MNTTTGTVIRVDEVRGPTVGLEPETVLPSQFFDRVHIDASLQPEKRLMLAVLEDGVGTFQKHAGATGRRARRLFAEAIRRGIVDVLQPELFGIGGMTELRKVAGLTSTHCVPMIPHANESGRHAVHFLFTQPTRFTPLAEWGVKINHNAQHFYRDFYEPMDGYFRVPDGPGFGYDIDPDKVVRRREL